MLPDTTVLNAALVVLTRILNKMAKVIISLKIMPSGIETNLDSVSEEANKLITAFGGKVGKTEKEPVAFGLNALKIMFIMDEQKGSTQSLEDDIAKLDGVNSVDVTDVRRTIG